MRCLKTTTCILRFFFNKDPYFKKVDSRAKNSTTKNPKASIMSTLQHYLTYSIQNVYDGVDNFWSAVVPTCDDYIAFNFSVPFPLKKYLFLMWMYRNDA